MYVIVIHLVSDIVFTILIPNKNMMWYKEMNYLFGKMKISLWIFVGTTNAPKSNAIIEVCHVLVIFVVFIIRRNTFCKKIYVNINASCSVSSSYKFTNSESFAIMFAFITERDLNEKEHLLHKSWEMSKRGQRFILVWTRV